jgi:hypothetical protein
MHSFLRSWCVLCAAVIAGCAGAPPAQDSGALVIDKTRGEVRAAAVVQKTDAPRMQDWGSAVPALLGARGGEFEKHFVFVTDAGVDVVYNALLALGGRARVVYRLEDVPAHKGIRPDNTPADYFQGDPVQIFVEWRDGERTRRAAYEDFFLEKVTVGGVETVKPWTPHFVLHGSGVLNRKQTGCIGCTHDCPGGIIGNNAFPLVEPIPVLRAQWDRLPPPGTRVTVIFRPVPSAGV